MIHEMKALPCSCRGAVRAGSEDGQRNRWRHVLRNVAKVNRLGGPWLCTSGGRQGRARRQGCGGGSGNLTQRRRPSPVVSWGHIQIAVGRTSHSPPHGQHRQPCIISWQVCQPDGVEGHCARRLSGGRQRGHRGPPGRCHHGPCLSATASRQALYRHSAGNPEVPVHLTQLSRARPEARRRCDNRLRCSVAPSPSSAGTSAPLRHADG